MTKTKLGKLRAQADAAIAPGPMKDLNEMLAEAANDKQVTVSTFLAPYRQGLPNLQPSQEVDNYLTLDANGDYEALVASQLTAWNANNGFAGASPAVGFGPVAVAQPLADGQQTDGVPQYDVPYDFTQVNGIYDTPVPGTATDASATWFNDDTELERQERTESAVFEEFCNF